MDAYFDIYSGISGNMVLGALFDLGLDREEFTEKLKALQLEDRYELKITKIKRQGITGTLAEVHLKETAGDKARHLADIKRLINKSTLSTSVKNKSIAIFESLARAEGKVHGKAPQEIHFHEVGAVDAIVDIVGSVLGLEMLEIQNIIASEIHTGEGFVTCQHGTIPVPAPATMNLLENIPLYSRGIKEELVTPTGAAIITTLATEFSSRPPMKIARTGYGAGSKELPIANFLRVNLGEFTGVANQDFVQEKDEVVLLETNIDDMNPEFYQHIIANLWQEGALDVYLTPIQMKKNRPGVKLSVLAEAKYKEKLVTIILTETTSLGVRIQQNITRACLAREMDLVVTPWGKVAVKIAYRKGEMVNVSPEYEDCLKIAQENKIAVKKVYQIAISCFYDQYDPKN